MPALVFGCTIADKIEKRGLLDEMVHLVNCADYFVYGRECSFQMIEY